MISPTPTQQRPEQQPEPEEKRAVKSTPARKRSGQTPIALFVKAIFRPIFKGIFYVLQAIRKHKWTTVGIILLLLISVSATTFFATGELPLGIGHDPFNFHVNGSNGGGDLVQHWLYALRDGDAATMNFLDQNMSQPPNASQLISQFSQTQAHLSWKTVNVVGVNTEGDTTVDSFVEVDISSHGPGGDVTGYLLWHFVTFNGANGEFLIEANLVESRGPLA